MKKLGNIIPVIGWLLALAWGAFFWFAPASWWVQDAGITIDDGIAGGPSPTVKLDLTYEKTILVHWTRILHKETDTTEWLACDVESAEMGFSGPQPVVTTLDALFEGKPCARDLTPGDYYVEADLEWNDGAQRSLSIESNIFTIKPAPAPPSRRAPPVAVQAPAAPSALPHYHRHSAAPVIPWPFSLFLGHHR